jgi:hypothetical protein
MGNILNRNDPDGGKWDRDIEHHLQVRWDQMFDALPASVANEPGAITEFLLATRCFSVIEIERNMDEIIKWRAAK